MAMAMAMADSVELRASVTSIKIVDPYARDILATSTHVALYQFNNSSNEWEKTDTEGALFVYSRHGQPYHSLMIVNRLSRTNLIEPIVREFEYQMQAPFLLFRNGKAKIYGVWFYKRDDCFNITYVLESLIEGLKEKMGDKSKPKPGSIDIFGLLSKAQEDFKRTPIKSELLQQQQQQQQQIHQIQHQQQNVLPPPQFSTQSSTSTPQRKEQGTSQSVMDFFAKASNNKSQQQQQQQQPPQQIPQNQQQKEIPQNQAESSEFFMQRLMLNPEHTVEHIEKQQRSITPQDISTKRSLLMNLQKECRSVPINIEKKLQNRERENRERDLTNGFSFINMEGTSPNQSTLNNFFLNKMSGLGQEDVKEQSKQAACREFIVSSPLAQPLDVSLSSSSSVKPTLLAPTVFSSSAVEDSLLQQHQHSTSRQQIQQQQNNSIEPLNKNQMLQALNYLLTNDQEFINKLHDAYVKSLQEVVKLKTTSSSSSTSMH